MADDSSQVSETPSVESLGSVSSLLSRRSSGGKIRANLNLESHIDGLFGGNEVMKSLLHPKGYAVGQVIGRSSHRRTLVCKAQHDIESVAIKGSTGPPHEVEPAFIKEYEILSRLRHPNIVSVIDYIQEEMRACMIIMEFCQGCLLLEYLPWDGCILAMPARCVVVQEVFSALAYLHEQSVAHCSIRPKNIMVNLVDGFCDFGPDTTVPQCKLIGFDEAVCFLTAEGDYAAAFRKDVYAAGLVAAGLVAGSSLTTRDVYIDQALTLPRPPHGNELMPEAARFLSSVLSLDASIRPVCSAALEAIPRKDAWLQPAHRVERL
eukprot:TRINITY_DN19450_c0_g3_i1.p1 TRINITY_DN19450_c0_g3~~TRINITY_DN19450_c0_g3_i1.p1  ORF type:complete len:340 (-),score=46.46 TRINITY_DN19450_c0_g3_i1:221-1180(-)